MLVLLAAVALADPSPVTWDTLTEDALIAWETGPGRAQSHRTQAADAAVHRVRLGPDAVRAEVQWGVPAQQMVLTAASMPLDLGLAERGQVKASAAEQHAIARQAQWRWVSRVQEAWLAWWAASEMAHHLDAYAEDTVDGLAGIQEAADLGLIAPLDLQDLVAESVQVRAEAAAAEQRAAIARAELIALIGDRPLDGDGHELHDLPDVSTNPWTGLAERAAAHPAVQVASARATTERRRATALAASRLPTVEAGPMWGPDEAGDIKGLLFAGISVPLQPGVGPEQRMARGEAAAATAEARWLTEQLRAELHTEAERYTAIVRHLQQLQDDVLLPLQSRQETLEAAFAEGLVTAERVVRARQERHGAEHELLDVAGELLASTARAEAMRHVLEDTP